MRAQELAGHDLRYLLDLYLKESKNFSTALEEGASWQTLQEMRVGLRELNNVISQKYDALYGSRRLRHQPPHGD